MAGPLMIVPAAGGAAAGLGLRSVLGTILSGSAKRLAGGAGRLAATGGKFATGAALGLGVPLAIDGVSSADSFKLNEGSPTATVLPGGGKAYAPLPSELPTFPSMADHIPQQVGIKRAGKVDPGMIPDADRVKVADIGDILSRNREAYPELKKVDRKVDLPKFFDPEASDEIVSQRWAGALEGALRGDNVGEILAGAAAGVHGANAKYTKEEIARREYDTAAENMYGQRRWTDLLGLDQEEIANRRAQAQLDSDYEGRRIQSGTARAGVASNNEDRMQQANQAEASLAQAYQGLLEARSDRQMRRGVAMHDAQLRHLDRTDMRNLLMHERGAQQATDMLQSQTAAITNQPWAKDLQATGLGQTGVFVNLQKAQDLAANNPQGAYVALQEAYNELQSWQPRGIGIGERELMAKQKGLEQLSKAIAQYSEYAKPAAINTPTAPVRTYDILPTQRSVEKGIIEYLFQ